MDGTCRLAGVVHTVDVSAFHGLFLCYIFNFCSLSAMQLAPAAGWVHSLAKALGCGATSNLRLEVRICPNPVAPLQCFRQSIQSVCARWVRGLGPGVTHSTLPTWPRKRGLRKKTSGSHNCLERVSTESFHAYVFCSANLLSNPAATHGPS